MMTVNGVRTTDLYCILNNLKNKISFKLLEHLSIQNKILKREHLMGTIKILKTCMMFITLIYLNLKLRIYTDVT